MEIHPLEDCGNAPKNQLVHDFCLSYLLSTCENHDKEMVNPNGHLLDLYGSMGGKPSTRGILQKIVLKSAISHGKLGSVEFDTVDNHGKVHSGCIVIEFQTSAAKRIVRVTEYALESAN